MQMGVTVLRASPESDIDGYSIRPLHEVAEDLERQGGFITRRRSSFIESIFLVEGRLLPVEIAGTLLRGVVFRRSAVHPDFISAYVADAAKHDKQFRILKSLLCLVQLKTLHDISEKEVQHVIDTYIINSPYKKNAGPWHDRSPWVMLFKKGTLSGISDRCLTYAANIFWHYRSTKTMAITGPDGVGKSTLIAMLQSYDGIRTVYMGQRAFRTEKIINRLQRIQKISVPFVQAVIFTEYCCRLIRAQFLRLRGFDIVFDRYPVFDYAVSPNSFDRALGRTIYRYLFPRPKKIFLLTAPAAQIAARKTEMNEDEINALYRRAEGFDVIKIDNSGSIQDATMRILRAFYGSL